MSKLKRSFVSLQQILLVVIGVAVVFFALLNLDPVTVDLLFTQVQTSVALLLLVPLLAGMSIGWIGGRLAARRRAARGRELDAPAQPAELAPGEGPPADEEWADLDLDEIET